MSEFTFEHPLERHGEEIVVTVAGRYFGGSTSRDWYQPDDEPEVEIEAITLGGVEFEVLPDELEAIESAAWSEGEAQAKSDRDEAAIARWESSHDAY